MPTDLQPVTPPRYGAPRSSGQLPKPHPETPIARTARRLGCAERTVKLAIPRAIRLLTMHIQSLRETRGEEAVVLFLAPLEQALVSCSEPVDALSIAEEQADTAESTAQLAYYLNKCQDTARTYRTALQRQAIRSDRRAAALTREWRL